MDESWGKSAFSIRLTFGGRNINLMRAFQPRFVIRAEWSKFVHTHTAEGHSGRWNCTLCCEGGMKANVSVSGHDTVEYKWHCHQVLHKVPREFHSSKLHYLEDLEALCQNEKREEKAVISKWKTLHYNWLQGWKSPVTIIQGYFVFSCVHSFSEVTNVRMWKRILSTWGRGYDWPQGHKYRLISWWPLAWISCLLFVDGWILDDQYMLVPIFFLWDPKYIIRM